MENDIVNRVEKSGLIQVSLDDFYPQGERVIFDIKDLLHEGFVLIEKDLRAFVKQNDWSLFKDKYIAITCSTDAIVPLWAYMLIATNLKPFARKVVLGNKIDLEKAIFADILNNHDFSIYKDAAVIVKGCGKYPIPESVVLDFAFRLQDVAKSIMFGEACSAVPLYKR
ncbi:MAG: DUF2480 family protein [Flavobacteriales bacterium]|nr:MAG: DUF2480 family protein [Flavobacteriales bacterium]